MSEEVEESEGVMYSDEAARWKVSRLLQVQEMLWMPGGLGSGELGLFWFAAVKSQCLFRKIGMSEKARKRCVFIWALEVVSGVGVWDVCACLARTWIV
jgi:hypothetical protein